MNHFRHTRRSSWVALGATLATLVGAASVHQADAADTSTVASMFVPIPPVRVVDTRVTDTRVTDTTGILEVRFTGEIALPDGKVDELAPVGATAVSLNVTAVNAVGRRGAGYVTVHPCDQPTPYTSNLNFKTGQTVPNAVIAPLAADGRTCFAVYGSAHLLADINGYFVASSDQRSATPNIDAYTQREVDALLALKSDLTTVDSVTDSITAINDDVDSMRATLDSKVDATALDELATSRDIDDVTTQLGSLETQVDDLAGAVDALSPTDLSEFDARVGAVETTVGALDTDLAAVASRLTAVESSRTSAGSGSNSLLPIDASGTDADLAITPNGRIVIAAHRVSSGLVVAVCEDDSCATTTTTVVDGTTTSGHDPSIAIGRNGYPVIAHHDATHTDLIVTACATLSCSSATTTRLATPQIDGLTPQVIIGADGFPRIVHQAHDASALPKVGHLNLVTCAERTCAGTGTLAPASVIVDEGDVSIALAAGFEPSLSLGLAGNPIIVHQTRRHSGTTVIATSLDLIVCNDDACTGADERTVSIRSDSTDSVGWSPSVVLAAGGSPVIAYTDGASLLITECLNSACSGRQTATLALDATAATGSLDLTLGTFGQPVVAYTTTTDDLGIAVCSPSGCATNSIASFTTDDLDGATPAVVRDARGTPVVLSSNLMGDLSLLSAWWTSP